MQARSLLRRALPFALAFAALQFGWQCLREGSAGRFVIEMATARPAAALVNLVTPGAHAHAQGSTVQARGGGLHIINGCDGTETLFLLAAAFVAAPIAPRARLTGFLIGTLVVFAVNQLRILALFYVLRGEPAWFEALHATITPIGVVLLVALYFHA
ncbi:MAG TPA: hypothetical protein VMB48_13760, partial [Steroidobacteraceae bacterium]|nr:hypothetical protein [Steroidobacteraceae bacterium]